MALLAWLRTGRPAGYTEPEPITQVRARLGWTVVSVATDWETLFG